jgi:hypothetical protein
VRAGDRATEFASRCRQLGIQGVTLHSYRYAWAERAKTGGYANEVIAANIAPIRIYFDFILPFLTSDFKELLPGHGFYVLFFCGSPQDYCRKIPPCIDLVRLI